MLTLISACLKAFNDYFSRMSLADVEQMALKLSESDRALLASVLLESVPPDCLEDRVDEAERREREMEEGRVGEISYEELLKRVDAERRR
jgi:hypothetical protein